jgi:hypothetical protein
MPIGDSGRVVIEVEPYLKRQLYSALAADGSTLKAWFIETANTYLRDREQPRLLFNAPKESGQRP